MGHLVRRGTWVLAGHIGACALLVAVAFRAHGRSPDPVDVAHEATALIPAEYREGVTQRLAGAGENRDQIIEAISRCKTDQREGLSFLLLNMPESDLKSLKADFLLKNVTLAYEARTRHPWASSIPLDVFLNDVLPYANVNERRDEWRSDFVARFGSVVKECKSATEAAQLLNRTVFKTLGVQYHATKRRKPDQSPAESQEIGFASCTGLSIILADACRAVGIPARVVGTPHWSDDSGNHTWVEFWDGQWWYIGAAEPGELNATWFSAAAAKADDSRPEYRIYAASFRKTDQPFIMIWSRRKDISAVDVSKYYIHRQKVSVGVVGADNAPIESTIRLTTDSQAIGEVHGSSAVFEIGADADYLVHAASGTRFVEQKIHLGADADAAVRLVLADPVALDPKPESKAGPTSAAPAGLDTPIDALKCWLGKPSADRPALDAQPFSKIPLTKVQSAEAKSLLWEDHVSALRAARETEWKADTVVAAGKTMKFLRKNFGEKPAGGWNLFISMHGGGNTSQKINDQQWLNQIKLYEPANSLYIAPRAPTNTWNLWHEPHIDALFDQLIQEAIVLEGVNPDRVYIMGYSAGGDGVYQLAPRMADRLAAASMMAGHPNDASPLGLRNIGFTIHVGALDNGYDRNKIAQKWGGLLDDLQKTDPTGYQHEVKLHEGRPHWMNREDAVAVEWMAKFTRNPLPERIVWKQAGTTHDRFYWLAMPPAEAKKDQEIVAQRSGQTIDILKADGVQSLTVLLNDDMLDLDQPVNVTVAGKPAVAATVPRTIATIADSIAQRGDPRAVFSGAVRVEIAGSSLAPTRPTP